MRTINTVLEDVINVQADASGYLKHRIFRSVNDTAKISNYSALFSAYKVNKVVVKLYPTDPIREGMVWFLAAPSDETGGGTWTAVTVETAADILNTGDAQLGEANRRYTHSVQFPKGNTFLELDGSDDPDETIMDALTFKIFSDQTFAFGASEIIFYALIEWHVTLVYQEL